MARWKASEKVEEVVAAAAEKAPVQVCNCEKLKAGLRALCADVHSEIARNGNALWPSLERARSLLEELDAK